MSKHKFLVFMTLVLVAAVVAWSFGPALAKQPVTTNDAAKYLGKVTPAEKTAAAQRAKDAGLLPGVAGLAAAAGPIPGIEGPGGCRIITALTATGRSARCRQDPLTSSQLMRPAPGYAVGDTVQIVDAYAPAAERASRSLPWTRPPAASRLHNYRRYGLQCSHR